MSMTKSGTYSEIVGTFVDQGMGSFQPHQMEAKLGPY